jgi:hypothetical protein
VSSQPTPKRIQRRRVKGWRMPDGAVYVGRPTRWGNPIPIEATGRFDDQGRAEYVATITVQQRVEIRRALRGRDLACWCPLVDKDGNPVHCHADVLLEIANG